MVGLFQWFDNVETKLDAIIGQLLTLHRKANAIMGAVQVAQEDLDQLDTDLDAATQAIADKLDELATAHPELPEADLAALRENVETLRGLATPTTTPVEEEPPVE